MPQHIEKIQNFKIEFDEKRILRLLGHKKKFEEIKESLKTIIREEKKKLDSLLHPTAIYSIINYEATNKHPVFKNALKVAFCICTIGPELEEEIKKLTKQNELFKAMVLDAFGSEAAEEVAIQSDKILAKKAREMNLWPSKRFSPGYGIWDIREQRFIFGVLPGKDIGVYLTESCMMVPRKSISFRINFYMDQKLSTRKYKF